MRELTPDLAQRQRVVTWRAVLAGSLCSAFIAVGAPYSVLKVVGAHMGMDFSVPAAVFTMFLLALVVNGVRLLTGGRSILNRGEMLVAYSMMAVSCAICTLGLTAYLVPKIAAPLYYASSENRWGEILLPGMEKWPMLATSGEGLNAARYLFEGAPDDLPFSQAIPLVWAWARPLGYWTILLVAFYATSICLMAVFRHQWVERERIVFPLVQLPMELAAEPVGPHAKIAAIFRSRLFWTGFAVPFIFCCLLALPAYFPVMTALKPRLSQPAYLLQETWRLDFRISWQAIGLAYLINTDISLSIWLFSLFGSFYIGLSKFLGFMDPQRGVNFDMRHFGIGALTALVALRLWFVRKRLMGVVRKGLGLATDVDDRHEPVSYFAAFWGVVIGTIIMVVWLMASGMSLLIAVLIVLTAFMGLVGISRVIAETGIPVSRVPVTSPYLVHTAVGTWAIGRKGLLATYWVSIWNGDARTSVMTSAIHGMRACSDRKHSYRRLFGAMMLAVVIAWVFSTVTTILFAYKYGGVNLRSWYFQISPNRSLNSFARLVTEGLRGPNVRGLLAAGTGAAVMLAFSVARYAFVWWPLNPVALPLSVALLTQYLWLSFFISWVIKSLILRYGGPGLFRRFRPFFLGLVLGQYAGSAFWIVIDGINGVTYNTTFVI